MQSIFVIGPSGCGTTMIGRILSSVPGAAALAGNHANDATTPAPLRDCSAWLDEITTRLWSERSTFAQRTEAQRDLADAIKTLRAIASENAITRLVWKRSTPFLEDNDHAPHLGDLPLFPGSHRVVLVTRDPRASAGSTLRRDHHAGLRRASVVCEQRWTLLAQQASASTPGTCIHLAYEQFCRDPYSHADRLAAHCDYDPSDLRDAIAAEGVSSDRLDAWKTRLAPGDIASLEAFFDATRLASMLSMFEAFPQAHDPSLAGNP